MYYHIIIELKEKIKKGKNEVNKIIFELDIKTKDETISDFISPYLKNEKFLFDGQYIASEKISSLHVYTTEHDSSSLRDKAQATVRPNTLIVYTCSIVVQMDAYASKITKTILKEVSEQLKEKLPTNVNNICLDKTKVFIVHGYDNEAKLEVSKFINDLGFEPIVLHEQASGGSTIIEKIENHSNVGFGVVLYTPCDVGSKHGAENLSARARQNVVFEHGYLVGKLGRDKVCFLVKGKVETPNDIDGGVYIKLDEHGAWKLNLGKELRNADYPVDMNKIT